MDVAAFVAERREEIAAFGQQLFREDANNNNNNTGTHAVRPSTRAAVFRRPSSRNIAISKVLREASRRAQQNAARRTTSNKEQSLLADVQRSTHSPTTTTTTTATTSRRALSCDGWRRLLKRRHRLICARRRTSQRRCLVRQHALMYGKVPPSCVCVGEMCSAHNNNTRTMKMWLATHIYTCSRFQSFTQTHVLDASSVHASSSPSSSNCVVRVLVPDVAHRTCHRMFQRYLTQLLRAVAQPTTQQQQQQQQRSLMSAPRPPHTLIADLSHECVYTIVGAPRIIHVGDEAAMLAQLLHVAHLLHLVANTAPTHHHDCVFLDDVHRNNKLRSSVAVLSGHMSGSSPSTPAVVPASLVVVGTHKQQQQHGDDDDGECVVLLLTAAPVRVSMRFTRALSLRLVSSWSPCSATQTCASMLELWWSSAAHTTQEDAIVRMCGKAVRRAHTTTKTTTSSSSSSSSSTCCNMVVVLPSSLVVPGRKYAHQFDACIHRVLVVSSSSSTTKEMKVREGDDDEDAERSTTHTITSNKRLRATHVVFVRRVFRCLRKQACISATDARFRCAAKTIGAEDRRLLLQLLGRPSFPHDYQLPTTTTTTSLVDVLRMFGHVGNAAQRVMVRAVRGHVLHAHIATPGSYLMAVGARTTHDDDDDDDGVVVHRVGIITSGAIFSMRHGAEVCNVWQCFSTISNNNNNNINKMHTKPVWSYVITSATQAQTLMELSGTAATPIAVLEKRKRQRTNAVVHHLRHHQQQQQQRRLQLLLLNEDDVNVVEVVESFL